MGVKEVGRRIDNLGTLHCHELSKLYVHPTLGQDREMRIKEGFHDIKLIDVFVGVI